jgi:signal transduction histidine kinase
MQIFRILQEALSNARKHGQARCVQVTFVAEDHLVCMTIQDDGGGFNASPSDLETDGHFGLRFMHERAEALGGCLEVISKPGEGTRVVARAPMRTLLSIRGSEVNHA